MQYLPRPNFFLVGAMKSGTTTLANLLARHPSVFLPRVKEPNHFCVDINDGKAQHAQKHSFDAIKVDDLLRKKDNVRRHTAIVRDHRDYLRLYEGGIGCAIRGDCSTSYLLSKVAAHEIRNFAPTAKILIILRNPVNRAISEFRMRSMIGSTKGTFYQELYEEVKAISQDNDIYHGCRTYIRAGMYAKQIRRYIDSFEREQISIMIFERIFGDTPHYMQEIFDHLNINTFDIGIGERSNPGLLPRSSALGRILYLMNGNYLVGKYGPKLALPLKRKLKDIWFKEDHGDYTVEKTILSMVFRNEINEVREILNDELPEWKA